MMLMTLSGTGAVIDAESLESALRDRYRHLHVARSTSGRGVNIGVLAEPFQPILDLADSLSTLAIQGSWAEAAEIAAVVRGALPADAPALVLLDDDGTGFADVPAGSTPESVAAGWKDISHFPGYPAG
jgi:hypothetical protein